MDNPWATLRQGWQDAKNGEPLFEDADPAYAAAWCAFHNVVNPYTAGGDETRKD